MYKDVTTTNRPNFVSPIPQGGRRQQDNGLRGYFGAITNMDDNIGRLMAFLEEQGLSDNTIVVLTADHGDMLGSHDEWGKKIWYEESIGVPFIIRWSKVIAPGRTDALFNQVDIVPTLLGLIGVEIPERVEGTNFAPLIQGKEMNQPDSALIFYHTDKKQWRALRTKRYTYVIDFDAKRRNTERIDHILYDLGKDPYQMNPIRTGQEQDELMKELEQQLCEWLDKTKDPFLNMK